MPDLAYDAKGDIDEISSIARKVLEDLEAFVDGTGECDELEDEDSTDGTEAKPIGVSLEELRLILDTSIQRHGLRHTRPDDVTRANSLISPIRKMDNASVTPAPTLNLLSSKKTRLIKQRREHHSKPVVVPLLDLRHLLSCKREEFARLREENRRRIERSWYSRQPSDQQVRGASLPPNHNKLEKEAANDPIFAVGRTDTANGDVSKSPSEFCASMTSSRGASVGSSNRSSAHVKRLERSESLKSDGKTVLKFSPTQQSEHTQPTTTEKACNTQPSDFGPDVNDIPNVVLCETEEVRQKSKPGQRRDQHLLPKHSANVFLSAVSESSWSSSCQSSSRASSSASSSSRHSANRSTSSRHNSGLQKSDCRDDNRTPPAQHVSRSTSSDHYSPFIPVTLRQDAQLEWELDLSNFNI